MREQKELNEFNYVILFIYNLFRNIQDDLQKEYDSRLKETEEHYKNIINERKK